MPLHLEKYLTCVCEVRSLNNELLGAAIVSEAQNDALILRGASGHKMPLIRYNTPVKVSILSKESDFIMLVGTVFTSTEDQMKLTGLITLQQYERRNFFRVNVNGEVWLYPDQPEAHLHPADQQRLSQGMLHATSPKKIEPISCVMRDVSLGGCLIETEKDIALGQKFIAEFVLVQLKHKLHMMVCRHAVSTEEARNVNRFGCSFLGNREHQIDAVCKDLFLLQRKMIQRKRGAE